MSKPFVSSYEEKFLEAFGRGVEKMPDDFEKTIKTMTDTIMDQVISNLEYYIQSDMKRNLNDEIRREAASVASSMLANALAGDDKTIRNLFGFNDWYMNHSYINDGNPTQWNLILAIADKRPNILVDERIHQLTKKAEMYEKEIFRLKGYIEWQRQKLDGEIEA